MVPAVCCLVCAQHAAGDAIVATADWHYPDLAASGHHHHRAECRSRTTASFAVAAAGAVSKDDALQRVDPRPVQPVGFRNRAIALDLQCPGLDGGRHAACTYSLISPPRTQRRRIFAVVRSVMAAGVISEGRGGRRSRACGVLEVCLACELQRCTGVSGGP